MQIILDGVPYTLSDGFLVSVLVGPFVPAMIVVMTAFALEQEVLEHELLLLLQLLLQEEVLVCFSPLWVLPAVLPFPLSSLLPLLFLLRGAVR